MPYVTFLQMSILTRTTSRIETDILIHQSIGNVVSNNKYIFSDNILRTFKKNLFP